MNFIYYNLKIKRYGDGSFQIITYKNPMPIGENVDKKSSKKIVLEKNEYSIEENINRSLRRSKERIIDYGRSNNWELFCTFTFDKNLIERENYDECSKKIRKWFNNQRRKNPDLKYLIVPEEHKNGGWHFHALVSNVCWNLEQAINPHTNKLIKKNGKQLYNIDNWQNGFSTATKITDTKKSVSYMTKYITKDLINMTLGRQRYFVSEGLNLPELVVLLKKYESINDYIKNFAELHEMNVSFCKTVQIENIDYSNIITYYELQ